MPVIVLYCWFYQSAAGFHIYWTSRGLEELAPHLHCPLCLFSLSGNCCEWQQVEKEEGPPLLAHFYGLCSRDAGVLKEKATIPLGHLHLFAFSLWQGGESCSATASFQPPLLPCCLSPFFLPDSSDDTNRNNLSSFHPSSSGPTCPLIFSVAPTSSSIGLHCVPTHCIISRFVDCMLSVEVQTIVWEIL